MARIRGKGNKDTELRMMALFREYGITGWRRHQPVFGKPDFIFRKQRVALFIDGCFWHGCPKPKHAPLPKTNAEFWEKKLAKNRERDAIVTATLQAKGWRVLRIWECELGRSHWTDVAAQVKVEMS